MKFLIHFGQNSFWYKVILGYNGTEVSIIFGVHIVINRKENCVVGSSDIGIADNTDGHMVGQNNSLASILVSEKELSLRAIHKLCWQKYEEFWHLLYPSYAVNLSMKGRGGVEILHNSVNVVYGWSITEVPISETKYFFRN